LLTPVSLNVVNTDSQNKGTCLDAILKNEIKSVNSNSAGHASTKTPAERNWLHLKLFQERYYKLFKSLNIHTKQQIINSLFTLSV
jgi:hypothetical protein